MLLPESPFYPNSPIPPSKFVGRKAELERANRAVSQVFYGQSKSLFVTGDFGSGKSSFLELLLDYAEREAFLIPLKVKLGGISTLEELVPRIIQSSIEQTREHSAVENVKSWLSKYIESVEITGIKLNLKRIKEDLTNFSDLNYFFKELFKRYPKETYKGFVLALDEINGIADNPQFAHFLKSFLEENQTLKNSIPILLCLAGTEERRLKIIKQHEPVARLFDVIGMEPLTEGETLHYIANTFNEIGVNVDASALKRIYKNSEGYPKMIQIICEEIFWMLGERKRIDDKITLLGLGEAANTIGRKFVDAQVQSAIKSEKYRKILDKISVQFVTQDRFSKKEIDSILSDAERTALTNFITKMRSLGVLQATETRGEYRFTNRMVRAYLYLNASKP